MHPYNVAGDCLRRIGLLAPLTQRSGDFLLEPAVEQLCKTGMGASKEKYATHSDEEIRNSPELRRDAQILLEKHGTFIWRQAGNRNWLLTH